MALKKLKIKIPVNGHSDKDKAKMPIVDIEGDVVKQYNAASAAMKAAEDVMKDLRPEITEVGVGAVLEFNVGAPANPVASAKLVDATGASTLVSFTAKYSALGDTAKVENVENFFASLDGDVTDTDINHYVQETVQAKFNCKVFNDEVGVFSKLKYDKYRLALERVARELGDPCPLEVSKVLMPLEGFHAKRWAAFPSVELQMALAEVLPNVVTVKPIAPVDGAVAK